MADGSGSEFQDWEVLHDFDDHQLYSNFPHSNSSFFQVIQGDSSTICLDYFSLRNHESNAMTALESTVNDSDYRNCGRSTSEFGSESGDGFLDVNEFNQSHANGLSLSGFENFEGRESDYAKLSGSAKDRHSPMESKESGEESGSHLDDSRGNDSVAMKSGADGEQSDYIDLDSVDDVSNKDLGGEGGDSSETIEQGKEAKSCEVEAQTQTQTQRRMVVWWKVPFQVLRYFFLRASPSWSFSVAVAFMGMVILGRRLYKMKRKLKLAVDDKKVSQFADQAARLNEAFSVVRRVPVVRASLTRTQVQILGLP